MNDLLNTRWFCLLYELSQEVTNEEIQSAYKDFVEQVKIVGCSDDYSKTFRTLNLTRIELAQLQTVFRNEQEKKCPKISLYPKDSISCQC